MHFAAYKTFASKQSVQFALKRSVNVTPRLISIANFWWRYHKGILWSSLFISLCVCIPRTNRYVWITTNE